MRNKILTRGLQTLNIISFAFFYKITKEVLPLMYSSVFGVNSSVQSVFVFN